MIYDVTFYKKTCISGDKRYQCSLCGRRFIQSNHLKTHLRRMHHIDDSLPSIRTMHKVCTLYTTNWKFCVTNGSVDNFDTTVQLVDKLEFVCIIFWNRKANLRLVKLKFASSKTKVEVALVLTCSMF